LVERQPNPIDIHVGGRVRMRRILMGMSQEKLGEEIGLTFQQIQKYEKGSNRISASRLYQISRILNVPVQYFFEDVPDSDRNQTNSGNGGRERGATREIIDFISSAEGLQLNKAFAEIGDPVVRRKLVELLKTLAEKPDGTA
jgi:transcriptional regulator with XRE-family HTH domain